MLKCLPLCVALGHASSLLSLLLWHNNKLSRLDACPSAMREGKNFNTHFWAAYDTTSLKQFCLKKWEELILPWEIAKYTASLLSIFNVYEFCCFKFKFLPKNMKCFPFERSSKFHKLPFLIWEKILKCKGEQIDLKTELKLPNNLFYLY
jgi:hypothetical protein